MPKSSKALMDREGGVARARWASLQKEPHSRRSTKQTWASWAPTSSSLRSSNLALTHLFEMKLEQNSKSPIGTPKITILGKLDHINSPQKRFTSVMENTSHLERLTIKTSGGPFSLIKANTFLTAKLGSATTPSSRFSTI